MEHDSQDLNNKNSNDKEGYSLTRQTNHSVGNPASIEKVIKEMEKRYTQGTLAYTESLHRYTIEIEKLKAQIKTSIAEKAAEEKSLTKIEHENLYNEKLLDRLSDQFCKKAESIEELNDEYSSIIDTKEYTKILLRKKKDITALQDEIDEIETSLLDRELERLNLLEKLEPKRMAIAQMEAEITQLELEKEHFGLTKLQQIPYLELSQKSTTDELIDTVVLSKNEDEA